MKGLITCGLQGIGYAYSRKLIIPQVTYTVSTSKFLFSMSPEDYTEFTSATNTYVPTY
jgi:hypothetical protein